MHPIHHLGDRELSMYPLFTLVALLVASVLAVALTTRRGTPPRTAITIVAVVIAAGLVGARLFSAITATHPFLTDPSRLTALRAGDMAIYGGLIGAALAGMIVVRSYGLSIYRVGDHVAPAIGVGIALLRVGCFLRGCCFGTTTDLAVGVTYPAGSEAARFQIDGSGWSLFRAVEPVHPVPLYEIAAALLVAIIGYIALRRSTPDGTAAAIVVGGYSIARLLIHQVRAATPGGLPQWFEPLLYTSVLVAALCWGASRLAPVLNRNSPARSLAN